MEKEKKNGFTIPELLAVIAIIGILSIIAIGSYTTISKQMKQRTLENKLKLYKEAAYNYASDMQIEDETVTVGYLGELGYLDFEHPDAVRNERFDNPVTGEYLDCRIFSISRYLDDYNIEDTGKENCSLSESELKSDEIATKAYVYANGTYTDLTDFTVSDKIGDIDSGEAEVSFWDKIFGNAFGDDITEIINKEYGSLAKFFEWLFPKADAKSASDTYTVYPWSNKEVYVFFDFNNTTYAMSDNTVEYEMGGTKTTQTGKICSNINEGNCANVLRVDATLLFNSLVKATINTEYGKVSKKVMVRIDKEAPTAKISYDASITTNNIVVNLNGEDGSGSGIIGYYFGTNANPSLDDFTKLNIGYVNKNGTYYYAVVDNAGNMSKVESVNIDSIDKSGPVGYIEQNKRTTWSKEDYPIRFGCSSDTKTGCANKVIYSIINNETNEYIVQNQTVDSKDVGITISTPANTTLRSVTLTYKIYDNLGNESTKAETIDTYIDKVEKKQDTCSGCGCSGGSSGNNGDTTKPDSEKTCKGLMGLACVIEGALVGGLGGEIVGAVVFPIGSAVGTVVGAIGGAISGILCWIFC